LGLSDRQDEITLNQQRVFWKRNRQVACGDSTNELVALNGTVTNIGT
jgi:hypothetical protein